MMATVAFVSQKGGVGKSTLARALGAVAAHAGLKVRIADLDPDQSTVVAWQKSRQKEKIGGRIDVRGYETSSEAVTDAVGIELLLLDMPGRANMATLEAARLSQLVVLPTGPSLDDLRPCVLLLHELVAAGMPKSKLTVAICRTLDDAEEAAARAYIETAGYSVLPGALPERSAYRRAMNMGSAVTETENATLSARADELVEAMLKRIAEILVAVTATADGSKGKKVS